VCLLGQLSSLRAPSIVWEWEVLGLGCSALVKINVLWVLLHCEILKIFNGKKIPHAVPPLWSVLALQLLGLVTITHANIQS
jgi:hypothetical protein